jgi:hypothetical protein
MIPLHSQEISVIPLNGGLFVSKNFYLKFKVLKMFVMPCRSRDFTLFSLELYLIAPVVKMS